MSFRFSSEVLPKRKPRHTTSLSLLCDDCIPFLHVEHCAVCQRDQFGLVRGVFRKTSDSEASPKTHLMSLAGKVARLSHS